MYVEQLYTNCLAEAAYYIESDGEAAIIDPIREIDAYIQKAASRDAKIVYVLETHFHADFVSGHIDLANATGAPIVFGPGAETEYPVHHARNGEVFRLGKAMIEVLHTPGHTPESTCYLLYDENAKPHALFSGDTLFVGDVGRPDLLDGVMTKEALAGMMYDSLQKLKALPDSVLVYPAHGPGSACGKNIGRETWSTLGKQKETNYALRDQSREEFVAKLTSGLAAPPQYYFKDAAINKRGYESLKDVLEANVKPLTLHNLDEALAAGALVIDARKADDFEQGHIPNSMNVGLDDKYAWWVGTLVDIATPLVIVAPPLREEEAIRRLARIGYENVRGYLEGGFATWKNSGRDIATTGSIDPHEFPVRADENVEVLDVRNIGEYENGHIDGAKHIPLGELPDRLSELDPNTTYLIHCGGGYRSMIAASVLERNGFSRVENVRGGFSKMKGLIPDRIVTEAAAV